MLKLVPLPAAEAAGEKVQFAPTGRPEHENETIPENPFAGSTPTETVPDCPPVRVSVLGETVSAKSGGGRFIVYAADATKLDEYPGAMATASMVSFAET